MDKELKDRAMQHLSKMAADSEAEGAADWLRSPRTRAALQAAATGLPIGGGLGALYTFISPGRGQGIGRYLRNILLGGLGGGAFSLAANWDDIWNALPPAAAEVRDMLKSLPRPSSVTDMPLAKHVLSALPPYWLGHLPIVGKMAPTGRVYRYLGPRWWTIDERTEHRLRKMESYLSKALGRSKGEIRKALGQIEPHIVAEQIGGIRPDILKSERGEANRALRQMRKRYRPSNILEWLRSRL